jgi:hypothetical protein
MGITRRNALYQDPNLAKAFDNIAKAFAPPSGSDVYGYTHAAATRQQMARQQTAFANIAAGRGTAADYAAAGISDPSKNFALADMYRRSQLPGATPESLDTSSYAINGNANNTFEGQRRALASTERQKQMQTASDAITTAMTPVGKDATRFIPPAALPALGYGASPPPDAADASAPVALPASGGSVADAWANAPLPSAGAATPQDDLVSTIMRSNTAGAVSPELGAAPGGPSPIGVAQPGLQSAQTPADSAIPAAPNDLVSTIMRQPGQTPSAPPSSNAAPAGLVQYGTLSLQPGETVLTPDGRVLRGQPKTESQPEIQKLIAARDALATGDPNRKLYDERINALNQGNFQGAYEKQNDESLVKERETIASGAQSALADRDAYNVMLAAVNNPNVDQGTLGRARLALNKTLNAFGLDGGNTGPAEMLDALGKQISLRLRNPNGGAGMPGSLSDSDRQFLQSMSLSLGNSPQANRLLGQYYLAAEQRAVDLEQLAQSYEAQHGRLDNGWRAVKANYLQQTDPTAPIRDALAGRASSAPPQSAASSAPRSSAGRQPVRVTTPEEAAQLPSGTVFVAPDGTMRRAP